MKQWFTGKFAGHYRGAPRKQSSLAPYQDAERFSVQVYEAQVTALSLLALVPSVPAPGGAADEKTEGSAQSEAPDGHLVPDGQLVPDQSYHHVPMGATLHQPHIPYVHLVDAVRVGETIRTTARDVLMSELEFSFPARDQDTSFGRVEGVISGWFNPPPVPPELETAPPPPPDIPIGWSSDVVPTNAVVQTEVSSDGVSSLGDGTPSERTLGEKDVRQMPAYSDWDLAHGGSADESKGKAAGSEELDAVLPASQAIPPEYPFFVMGAVATGLIGLSAQPKAAAIFGLVFLIGYGLRRWLSGVVPDASGVRFLALVLCATQLLTAAWLLAGWSEAGCVRLSPLPLLSLVVSSLVASILPRPLPFGLTLGAFALVLLQAYGRWADALCQ